MRACAKLRALLFRRQQLRDPKVADSHLPDHDVRRLDVGVDDATPVDVPHPFDDLVDSDDDVKDLVTPTLERRI